MLRVQREDKERELATRHTCCGEGCRAGSALISVRPSHGEPFYPSENPIHAHWSIYLLPVGGQNRLYFLRPLRDPLVPRETRLGRETRHRLNELLHLVV